MRVLLIIICALSMQGLMAQESDNYQLSNPGVHTMGGSASSSNVDVRMQGLWFGQQASAANFELLEGLTLGAPPDHCAFIDSPMIDRDLVLIDGPSNIDSFQWFHDGVAIPGATSSTHEALLTGDYCLLVFTSDACVLKSNSVFVAIDGIEAVPSDAFMVYPVPVNHDQLFVTNAREALLLYDAKGRLMARYPAAAHRSINIAQWPSGVYYLRSGDQVQKVIIQ